MSPAQMFAMKVNASCTTTACEQNALRAISLACYAHAQNNPRAVMYGRPLDEATYDASRWIVEPFHLFDCCQENDGAAAMVLVVGRTGERLRAPAVLRACRSRRARHYRAAAPVHNTPEYASSSFTTLAPRLFDMAQLGPTDVDVLQSYENFTGGVLMSIVEHGFCKPDEVNDFFTVENLLAPSGELPLNTSGGNLAECYMHGSGLNIEAVRQIRGQSTSQVPGADVSMVISGPMVTPVSSSIFGAEATL